MKTGRPLFAHWAEITGRLRQARRIALFLDFDGTLAPFNPRPEDAELSFSMRQTLTRLADCSRVAVWVISGRNRADVRSRVRVPGVRCLGLHGWEGGVSEPIPRETRSVLESLKERLRQALHPLPKVWLEDKGMVIAVHYAYAEGSDAERARRIVTEEVTPWNGRLRLVAGERQAEVAAAEVRDKGAAVLREWSAWGRSALPVFIGDDVVDEPAFEALSDGITVRVSRTAPTAARYRVSGVPGVRRFLGRMLDYVGPTAGASDRLGCARIHVD